MQVTPRADVALHHKLPIDADEKILAVYKHHWFAYASSWILGIAVAFLVLAAAIALTMVGGDASPLAEHRGQVLVAAAAFSVLVLVGASVPVYLRSQEQVVLTEEALLQVLQPSLFSSKIDQLGLQNITDVSVRQDFFGTMFGYGHITVETPGEQDNYEFVILPNPHVTAREIIQAHENYEAALQSGRMPSTLGSNPAQNQQTAIDPQQYQQFLQYQQMVKQQQAQQGDDPAAQPPQDPDTQKQ